MGAKHASSKVDGFVYIYLTTIAFLGTTAAHSSPTPTAGNSGNLQYLYTKVSPEIQTIAANDAFQRVLKDTGYADKFEIIVDPDLSTSPFQDVFSIHWDEEKSKIIASGTTGVSALFGVNYYLKYFCNVQLAWEGRQVDFPEELPQVTFTKIIVDRFRYYENVCTESYTFTWWDWNKWEKQIDWMAFNGINLPLAFTGQEVFWEQLYIELGLEEADVNEYIAGPAFLAWWRMGNLQKWGGPVPRNYLEQKFALLRNILERMRSLGMLPVLPAFSGNVPKALLSIYPNVTYHQHPTWARFNSTYSETYMIDPTDPFFITIGRKFIKLLINSIGTDHVYNADTFNENRPEGSLKFLESAARAVYKSMEAGDEKAVWLMQGWLFTDTTYWKKERVQSYLRGVEIGNLLILDLIAESLPLFLIFDSFYGHGFIWCMLHNFGGTMNLYGSIELINQRLPKARIQASNGTFLGIGLAPEGINQNYVAYDFMTEMALYNQSVDTELWFSNYALRRYNGTSGSLNLEKVWHILQNGVYNHKWTAYTNHGHTVLTGRPGFSRSDDIWYKLTDLTTVIKLMLTESNSPSFNNSTLFLHDLVDFSRQFLVYTGGIIYYEMMDSFSNNNTLKFNESSYQLVQLLDDIDVVLSTRDWWLLGKWVEDAENWGANTEEKDLLRFNSLNQITLWGPNGEILDYASKHWAGLFGFYYKPRWELFLQTLKLSLENEVPYNDTKYKDQVLTEVEQPFTLSSSGSFLTEPYGDTITEVTRVYRKWKDTLITGASRFQAQMNLSSSSILRQREHRRLSITNNYYNTVLRRTSTPSRARSRPSFLTSQRLGLRDPLLMT